MYQAVLIEADGRVHVTEPAGKIPLGRQLIGEFSIAVVIVDAVIREKPLGVETAAGKVVAEAVDGAAYSRRGFRGCRVRRGNC